MNVLRGPFGGNCVQRRSDVVHAVLEHVGDLQYDVDKRLRRAPEIGNADVRAEVRVEHRGGRRRVGLLPRVSGGQVKVNYVLIDPRHTARLVKAQTWDVVDHAIAFRWHWSEGLDLDIWMPRERSDELPVIRLKPALARCHYISLPHHNPNSERRSPDPYQFGNVHRTPRRSQPPRSPPRSASDMAQT